MSKPSNTYRTAYLMFLLGILIGTTVIAYLLVANVPVPWAPLLIAYAPGIGVLGILAFTLARLCSMRQELFTPLIGLTGFTVPLDIVMATMAGAISEESLRFAIGALFVMAAWLSAGQAKLASQTKNHAAAQQHTNGSRA